MADRQVSWGSRFSGNLTQMKPSKIVDWIEHLRHGRTKAAAASAIAVFAVLGGVWQALGIHPGPPLLILLFGAAGAAALSSYMYLVVRSERHLQNLLKRTNVHEIHQELDSVLSRLEPDSAREVQEILVRLETQIDELQNELSKNKTREIPGRPELIGAGMFRMGIDRGSAEEGPAKPIFVSAFLMDRYPVTNHQFLDFISDAENALWLPEAVTARYGIPYYLVEWRGPEPPRPIWNHPVVWVGWFASAAFCNWRSRKDRLEEVYRFITPTEVESDLTRYGWRLPTEAEWEKAARAGLENDNLPFKDGRLSPSLANFGKYHKGTTPVGYFLPNDFGLYDMLGNVKEWCHDWYCDDFFKTADTPKDPAGATSGEAKAFRGGGWMDEPNRVTPWQRGKLPPRLTNPDFGFRCVRRP